MLITLAFPGFLLNYTGESDQLDMHSHKRYMH